MRFSSVGGKQKKLWLGFLWCSLLHSIRYLSKVTARFRSSHKLHAAIPWPSGN